MPSTTSRARTSGAEVGAALRAVGLTPRARAAWDGPPSPTIAAVALELFVRGAPVPRDRLRLGDAILASLVELGLVDQRGPELIARVAVLPLAGEALVVCDRADAKEEREVVPWPDDSSWHLAKSVPRGAGTWLDLCCGSAVAQLVRPEVAPLRVASDVNERAVRFARLGAALSGIPIDVAVRDVRAPASGRHELVTGNAPMPPLARDPAIWRRADADDVITSMFERARESLAPGGTIVLHVRRDRVPELLDGEVRLASYGHAHERFAVLRWRPDAPRDRREIVVGLTPAQPHVDSATFAAL